MLPCSLEIQAGVGEVETPVQCDGHTCDREWLGRYGGSEGINRSGRHHQAVGRILGGVYLHGNRVRSQQRAGGSGDGDCGFAAGESGRKRIFRQGPGGALGLECAGGLARGGAHAGTRDGDRQRVEREGHGGPGEAQRARAVQLHLAIAGGAPVGVFQREGGGGGDQVTQRESLAGDRFAGGGCHLLHIKGAERGGRPEILQAAHSRHCAGALELEILQRRIQHRIASQSDQTTEFLTLCGVETYLNLLVDCSEARTVSNQVAAEQKR